MNYMSNYVFRNKTAFHIDMEQTVAQLKKKTCAEALETTARVIIKHILGMSTPQVVINV